VAVATQPAGDSLDVARRALKSVPAELWQTAVAYCLHAHLVEQPSDPNTAGAAPEAEVAGASLQAALLGTCALVVHERYARGSAAHMSRAHSDSGGGCLFVGRF
jgi:hypothetical protein